MKRVKWEYMKLKIDYFLSEVKLDSFGSEGWELCSNTINVDEVIYIFKRPIYGRNKKED